MRSGGAIVLAAAMTCSSRARPPISWRTLGRLDFSRVPLPAAMMAIPNALVSIRCLSSHEGSSLGAAEVDNGRAVGFDLLGAEAPDCAEVVQGLRSGDCDVTQDRIATDEERRKPSLPGGFAAPCF